jgi:hypothetical protein
MNMTRVAYWRFHLRSGPIVEHLLQHKDHLGRIPLSGRLCYHWMQLDHILEDHHAVVSIEL